MIPTYFSLIASKTESEYKYIEKINNDQNTGYSIFIAGNGVLYKNFNENLLLEETSLYGKDYLIKDSLQTFDWKITSETKEILGFPLRKATLKLNDKTEVIAWFSAKLPIKNGPGVYGGLPGLILQLEKTTDYGTSSENISYSAVNIDALNQSVPIIRPSKGEKVSKTEFSQIEQQQYNKRMEMYGDGVDKD